MLRFLLSAVLLSVSLGPVVEGQTANVERLRVGPEEAGFHGAFNTSLSLQEGNTDTLKVGGDLRLIWAKSATAEDGEIFNRRVWLMSASVKFSEENDQRSINEAFAHLRWTRMRTPRWGYEAFLQGQYNEFIRLDRRLLLGGGLRLRLLASERQELFWGTGYMLEQERLDVPPDGPDDPESTHHRWTNYLSWKRTLGERNVRLGNTLYLQPRLDEPEDFRVLNETDLEVSLTERLSLGLKLRIAHDNDPPVDVEKTDYSLSNTLRLRF